MCLGWKCICHYTLDNALDLWQKMTRRDEYRLPFLLFEVGIDILDIDADDVVFLPVIRSSVVSLTL